MSQVDCVNLPRNLLCGLLLLALPRQTNAFQTFGCRDLLPAPIVPVYFIYVCTCSRVHVHMQKPQVLEDIPTALTVDPPCLAFSFSGILPLRQSTTTFSIHGGQHLTLASSRSFSTVKVFLQRSAGRCMQMHPSWNA
ncbi:hypothetical protein ABW21_db0206634 [Orbilia brochopaga]|nr:hypothetical protein ABW21_db0206634 [Drechslerella brochopaga]